MLRLLTFTLAAIFLTACDTDSGHPVAPSRNASLRDITLSNGTLYPAFNPTRRTYAVTVPTEDASIRITVLAADPNATVAIQDRPPQAEAAIANVDL